MAKITAKPLINVSLTMTIDEEEARALDALAGYNVDEFIKAFYEKLGKAYMEKHEDGLRRFITDIRRFIPPALSSLDRARAVFNQNENV